MADKLHCLICPVKVWFSLRFIADMNNTQKKKDCGGFWLWHVCWASGRNPLCNCIINLSSCCPLTPWLNDWWLLCLWLFYNITPALECHTIPNQMSVTFTLQLAKLFMSVGCCTNTREHVSGVGGAPSRPCLAVSRCSMEKECSWPGFSHSHVHYLFWIVLHCTY